MSKDAAPAPVKKKGGKKKLIMLVGGALLLIGGGAGAGMYAAGTGLGGNHGPKADPNQPQLVAREGAAEHGGEATGDAAKHADGKPDMTNYKATYYNLEQSFTSNLTDSDGFAQVGLGVSTYYDERVIEHVKDNEMPIRSAILLVLAQQEAMVLSTPGGKAELQEKLAKAVNEVLVQKTGFGGVDSVYFTAFIIQ